MSKIYLWIEDREGKSSYTFWKTMMEQICPNVIVESKNSNSELIKAVRLLSDNVNRYIIVLDNSFDNPQIYQEQKRLKQLIDEKDNIQMMDIICFEYILLEFDRLIDWIYAPLDEFKEKRFGAIQAREKLIRALKSDDLNYRIIREIIEYDSNLDNHNIEQLSAKLLFDLTRNTGFEVTKGHIGDCWIQSCCDWMERQDDDICGLDQSRITLKEKMQCIYKETSLCKEFAQTGLEVSLC